MPDAGSASPRSEQFAQLYVRQILPRQPGGHLETGPSPVADLTGDRCANALYLLDQRIDPNPARPQIIGRVSHAGIQSRFADPHDVVTWHTLLTAKVGHCQYGAAIVQDRAGGIGDG